METRLLRTREHRAPPRAGTSGPNRLHTYTHTAPHFEVLHQVVLKALCGKGYASQKTPEGSGWKERGFPGPVRRLPEREVCRGSGAGPSPSSLSARTHADEAGGLPCTLSPRQPFSPGEEPPPPAPSQKRERPSLSRYLVQFPPSSPLKKRPANFPRVLRGGPAGRRGPRARGRGEQGWGRGAGGWAEPQVLRKSPRPGGSRAGRESAGPGPRSLGVGRWPRPSSVTLPRLVGLPCVEFAARSLGCGRRPPFPVIPAPPPPHSRTGESFAESRTASRFPRSGTLFLGRGTRGEAEGEGRSGRAAGSGAELNAPRASTGEKLSLPLQCCSEHLERFPWPFCFVLNAKVAGETALKCSQVRAALIFLWGGHVIFSPLLRRRTGFAGRLLRASNKVQ